jgi:hypothetical protein
MGNHQLFGDAFFFLPQDRNNNLAYGYQLLADRYFQHIRDKIASEFLKRVPVFRSWFAIPTSDQKRF